MLTPARRRLTRFAGGVVAYNLAVVLWGAWVRISGSGAGCGSHWPMCNGEVVPQAPSVATLIEYAHRLTSGVCLLLAITLGLVAHRVLPRGHRARRAAFVSLAFVVLEALLGAGLVLLGLVDKDSSAQRAVVVALHLVNTFGLIGAGALTALWSTEHEQASPAERPPEKTPARDRWDRLLTLGAALVVVVSATGAITALGDTLFPLRAVGGEALLARVRDELSGAQHFLVRLRIIHPLLAMGAAAFLGWLLNEVRKRSADPRAAITALVLVYTQVVLGALNVMLSAPGWMQIVHLGTANLLWMALLATLVWRHRPGTLSVELSSGPTPASQRLPAHN